MNGSGVTQPVSDGGGSITVDGTITANAGSAIRLPHPRCVRKITTWCAARYSSFCLYRSGSALTRLRSSRSFWADDAVGLELPPERSVDVDEPHALVVAEALAAAEAKVAAALKKAEDATAQYEASAKRAATTNEASAKSANGLTSALNRYLGVAAIGMAAKRTLDFADALSEMSVRTGMNTDELQRLT